MLYYTILYYTIHKDTMQCNTIHDDGCIVVKWPNLTSSTLSPSVSLSLSLTLTFSSFSPSLLFDNLFFLTISSFSPYLILQLLFFASREFIFILMFMKSNLERSLLISLFILIIFFVIPLATISRVLWMRYVVHTCSETTYFSVTSLLAFSLHRKNTMSCSTNDHTKHYPPPHRLYVMNPSRRWWVRCKKLSRVSPRWFSNI